MSSTSRHGARRRRGGDRERAAHVGDLLGGVGHLALRRAVADALEHRLRTGARARAARRCAKSGTSVAAARATGPRRPSATGARHARTTSAAAADQLVVEAPRAAAGLHQRVPAAVAEPRERAALLGAHVVGDLAHRALGVGRHLLDLEHERARAQVQRRLAHERRVERPVEARRRCRPRSAPQSCGSGSSSSSCSARIRQRPSAPNAAIASCSRAAQRGDARVALGVVGPVAARHARPSACRRARPRPRRRAPSASPRSGPCRG